MLSYPFKSTDADRLFISLVVMASLFGDRGRRAARCVWRWPRHDLHCPSHQSTPSTKYVLQLSHTRGGGYESPHHPFSFFSSHCVGSALVLHLLSLPQRAECLAGSGSEWPAARARGQAEGVRLEVRLVKRRDGVLVPGLTAS